MFNVCRHLAGIGICQGKPQADVGQQGRRVDSHLLEVATSSHCRPGTAICGWQLVALESLLTSDAVTELQPSGMLDRALETVGISRSFIYYVVENSVDT